jgi:enterochelin esterase family protein
LPLAQSELKLVDLREAPGAFGVLGSSAGGRMALFTSLMQPGIFGHVLSQSGAFGTGDRESVVFPLVRHAPRRSLKLWLDCGRYESLLAANRQMHAALTGRGYDVIYREYNAGHNVPAWRNDVWRGLEHLYGANSRPDTCAGQAMNSSDSM